MTQGIKMDGSHHSGNACFVLGNGPSLLSHKPEDISKLHVIGTNRSFEYVQSDEHVVIDQKCFEDYGDALKDLWECGTPLWCPPGSPFGRVVPHLGRRRGCPEFSWDATREIHWRFAPYAAIQVAVTLGFKRIYLLGVDLCEHEGRGHFYDRPMGLALEGFQREGFGYIAGMSAAAKLFTVATVSDITMLRAFPRMTMRGALAVEGKL